MNKKLLLGNAAIARGLYEAGCLYVSSYPGTPSTEITENAALYDEIYAEWAPNEKVAYESALGAAIAGARSFTAMKHVGLNVAADPLFTSAYTGINGGFVVCVADDPAMHSSQNEQDSRHYAIAAKLPMLEPADSAECLEFAKTAFELSERFDTPVMLRVCTRVAHSQSVVVEGDRFDAGVKDYAKNPQKYIMNPGNAMRRHPVVEQRLADFCAYAAASKLNRIEWGDKKIGIVAAGASYLYAKEVFGDSASYLKLGIVNPLNADYIRTFANEVEKLYIIEELDPVIETFCKANGIDCVGKDLIPVVGELSQQKLAKLLLEKENDCIRYDGKIPVRPPIMCPGCPHRGLFYVLKKLGLTVLGDIGCYTLGGTAPLSALDTTICMGASVSGLHGFNKVRPEAVGKTVAVIGDSTFMHSGITGLVDIAYNRSASTVLVLDNHITGMTGHQQNPCTGLTLKNKPVEPIIIEDVCKAVGIKRVRVTDPNDVVATENAIKEELACDEPSVIVVRRPCALLKKVNYGCKYTVDCDKCRSCKKCMHIGCPAISIKDGKAHIDETLCVGCGLCDTMCKFDAIEKVVL